MNRALARLRNAISKFKEINEIFRKSLFLGPINIIESDDSELEVANIFRCNATVEDIEHTINKSHSAEEPLANRLQELGPRDNDDVYDVKFVNDDGEIVDVRYMDMERRKIVTNTKKMDGLYLQVTKTSTDEARTANSTAAKMYTILESHGEGTEVLKKGTVVLGDIRGKNLLIAEKLSDFRRRVIPKSKVQEAPVEMQESWGRYYQLRAESLRK